MTEISLNNKLFNIKELRHIMPQLTDWDLQPVAGRAVYRKRERYAHLEIKLYPSDSYDNRVIWNTDQTYFPYDIGISKAIEEYLLFFTNYLSALKGNDIKLIFEITDGTFHLVDSDNKTYGYAALYALIDCFDKSYNSVNEFKIEQIARMKAEAPAFFKSEGIHFTIEDLFRSLENIALTSIVKELVNHISDEELSLYLEQCNENRLNARIKPKLSEEQVIWFKEHKVLSRHGDLSQIGLWHIAIAR